MSRRVKDSEIDFSDIPELRDEELFKFKRRGRPVIGESPRKAISIRIEEGTLQKLKNQAKKKGVAYQSLINEILKKAV
jgi:predicted DNA binding CopG/RHH family protein